MRFGLLVNSPYPAGLDGSRMRQHLAQQAGIAYRGNFDALFAAQHYLTGPHSAMPQPFPTLAFLAAQAPGLSIGTAVFLLPLHDPVQVAEQTATLDILSGGRFLFGVGQGYRDVEFASAGVPRWQRRQRLEEALQVIRRLWNEDEVTFHGRFFHLDGVTAAPRPVQRPGPPILVGADTLRSVARVTELGEHWIASRRHTKAFLRQAVPAYRTALDQRGKEFSGLWLFRDLCMAPRPAEAEQRIKTAYERMYRLYQQWGQPGEAYAGSFEQLKEERLIAGSPEEVVDQVLAYHAEFGAEFMSFTVYWPGMDLDWALETIQIFGEEVIPAVKRATSRSAVLV